ncbi:MAG: serine/threonine-protein kinase, partial [Roseibacillus sp.]|nr:serine/threonine-protein kinase [Roseibacillus sp.]
ALQQEFWLLRKMAHPNLPAVHWGGLEESTSTSFYLMEWCRGMSLSSWLEAGPEEAEILSVADQLLDVVAHLHGQGVVHGDLNPENVLVRPGASGPTLKLLDLGLADSEKGSVSGALPYLAPERLEGGEGTFTSDVFSLGLVLYEALFGAHPFPGYPRAGVQEPLFPGADSGVRRAVKGVLSACMAVSPKDRPATSADIRRQFGSAPDSHVADKDLALRLAQLSKLPFVGSTPSIARVPTGASEGEGVHLFGAPGLGRSRYLEEVALQHRFFAPTVCLVDGRVTTGGFGAVDGVLASLFEDPETAELELPAGMGEALRDAVHMRFEIMRGEQEGSVDDDNGSEDPRHQHQHRVDALVRAILWYAANHALFLLVDDWEEVDGESRHVLRGLSRAIESGQAHGLQFMTTGETPFYDGEGHRSLPL